MCALVTGFQTFALPICVPHGPLAAVRGRLPVQGARVFSDPQPRVLDRIVREGLSAFVDEVDVDGHQEQVGSGVDLENDLRAGHIGEDQELRSEEHTSELQSLMRISYAVFCLKKKKKYHK